MKGSNQQTYNRVPQLGSSSRCPSINEQPDLPLSESCHDGSRSRTGDSLPDGEFSPHPTISINPLACIRSDESSIREEVCLQGDDFRDECARLPPRASRHQYAWSMIKRILTTNFVDDKGLLHLYRHLCRAGEDPDIDDGGLAMVKLIKLWVLSIIGIMLVHPLARWMDWEIDENYTLQDFVQYDFSIVLLDLLFFFVVGRLYNASCRGIDHLFPWGIFIILGSIYPSIANDFAFLRHSISMYDIMCSWPVPLFIYALALLVTAIVFGVALIRSHHRRNVLRSRIVEAITLLCLFILPYVRSDTFHLHHWFGMWWLGMQSNAPEWWARAFQAFALGSYINGIAVYGRDPILGCGLAFYRSTNLGCEYMECYKGAGNETEYKDFVTPDWRMCNAAALKDVT
mmetsp:Transcript_1982/g.3757  ORF Transcript_1982/g.3757 Transcript_1982/m.3757 type:complete len:400 (+) Transcript_1982:33-1232(+)|eukprot:CAMPEP_0201873402 /NCGR_PEP_ID=MMETSP0902-20130614/5920_1 /ASSEMBLY_ACC=CAM_ASM_000551 /TAXON_ID=420261 /ORGANISM="Thalassiosira antarctica, Strain CCMP982" /LENGTH=399 /DNA_ID=CAMNT_0048399993 /DNA_START=44 /DNA_END=1243 /DNA_ORIENTATION=+